MLDHRLNYPVNSSKQDLFIRKGKKSIIGNGVVVNPTALLEEIEKYTGEEIEQYTLSKEEYVSILKETEDESYDWKKLIKQANKEDGTEDEW